MNPAQQPEAGASPRGRAFDPRSVTRPAPALLTYYLVCSLLTIFGFPFVFTYYYIRYRTLQYRLDDEGVSMAWGLLFRKEVHLTYRRIQDIHVERNILHRWLGLATISLQTASGTSGAEMKIEGVLLPEALRDFLYSKMRGVREAEEPGDAAGTATDPAGAHDPSAEALALLEQIRDSLRAGRTGA